MSKCCVAAIVVIAFGAAAFGQGRGGGVPRTPWGHPDLQGRWTNATLTLLERPVEFGDKEFFTEAEAIEYSKTALERFLAANNFTEEAAISGEFVPGIWVEERNIVSTGRTSLIIGPTGRVPPLTPAARARVAARNAQRSADGPEARALNERCLWFPAGGPPLLPSIGYNSNHQIIQTPTHVLIYTEMGPAVRVIPLDGRSHLRDGLRQWQGDSRGRFEGDTLVIETTNFTDQTQFRGSAENLKLVERFERVDRNTIRYQVTANDPTSWTDSWTAEVPMRRLDGLLYEFACHEGNRGLANILSGARAIERQ